MLSHGRRGLWALAVGRLGPVCTLGFCLRRGGGQQGLLLPTYTLPGILRSKREAFTECPPAPGTEDETDGAPPSEGGGWGGALQVQRCWRVGRTKDALQRSEWQPPKDTPAQSLPLRPPSERVCRRNEVKDQEMRASQFRGAQSPGANVLRREGESRPSETRVTLRDAAPSRGTLGSPRAERGRRDPPLEPPEREHGPAPPGSRTLASRAGRGWRKQLPVTVAPPPRV